MAFVKTPPTATQPRHAAQQSGLLPQLLTPLYYHAGRSSREDVTAHNANGRA